MQRDGTRAALGYILPITLAVLALTLAGIVSISAVSPADGQKQAIFLLFGIAAALAMQMTDYRNLLVTSPLLYALSLMPVMYTVVGRFVSVPFVRPINGHSAWILLGPISFEPTELTKICMLLLLAWTLRGENESRSLWVMVRSLLICAIGILIILQQPDVGTILTLIPPMLTMIYLAGVKKRHFMALMVVGVVVAPLLWLSGKCPRADCDLCPNVPVLNHLPQFVKHFQRQRIQAMISGDERVLQNKGYQQERGLEALGSGGISGKGMGNVPVGCRVPESHTDMVFCLVGEQFGLVGVGVVILSYLLLFGSGLAISNEHREQPGRLLAAGLVVLLAGQSMQNMAMVLRLVPVTGVTLPFVSYGGSSLVASCAAVGLLINVARNNRKVKF